MMHRKRDDRPWGNFEQFTLNEISTVKILTVKAKQRLSLQYHKHREEFWKVIQGPVKVTVGKKVLKLKTGDEIKIPKAALHRLEAYSKPARVLEIAFGTFDENDIVRVQDDYKRV